MNDPEIVAAQSALDQRLWFGYGNEEQLAVLAAHEALKPVRELHRSTYLAHGRFCPEDGQMWPCGTAKLICSREDLL